MEMKTRCSKRRKSCFSRAVPGLAVLLGLAVSDYTLVVAAQINPQTKPAAGAARVFRAGAAASNNTPRLGISINGYFNDRAAANIHDELHARCLVLDDGRTRLAIVVCDSCMIPREVMDAAKQRIARQTAIPADHVLISATHTHTAPTCSAVFQSDPDKEYQQFLAARIADGVQRAVNNLVPAKIGWGAGQAPGEVFNRRWRMKPGTIPPNPFGGTNELVKMNPPVASADLIEPAGPTDPGVSVVSVQAADGHPLAVLANYSLHYVGTSRANDISADYYGAFCNRL
jgi:neutral ceramidase